MATAGAANLTAGQIRPVAREWIARNFSGPGGSPVPGLPEYDDRRGLWRVPLAPEGAEGRLVGEIRVDSKKRIVGSTDVSIVKSRLARPPGRKAAARGGGGVLAPHPTGNAVVLGDAAEVLDGLHADTAQLVVTSPPYYNARPEYSEYPEYPDYLEFLRGVFAKSHRILSDGRFFVINTSPVLVRRTSRGTSSRRMPIPYDVNGLMESAGFEFVDDIIWVKPEGAGWNAGRGRRFAADRQPLQYKPVPVTEHVMVYRKRTDRLIDWNLKRHHDRELIRQSLVLGDYDVTNVWRIHPSSNKEHPAVYPYKLAEKIIRYYSFKGDLVLDPFAGSGVTGRAAYDMGRRLFLIDNEEKYFGLMKKELAYASGVEFRKARR